MRTSKISKISFYSILMILILVHTNCLVGHASKSMTDVSVQLVNPPQIRENVINVKLNISFNNIDYYNEQIYLSYHIFGDSAESSIAENERIKVELNNDVMQIVELNIDMVEAIQLIGEDKLYVEFDIIDEKNGYWFSTEAMNFETTRIEFNSTLIDKLYEEIYSNVGIFGFNLVVTLLFGILAMIWYKKMKE